MRDAIQLTFPFSVLEKNNDEASNNDARSRVQHPGQRGALQEAETTGQSPGASRSELRKRECAGERRAGRKAGGREREEDPRKQRRIHAAARRRPAQGLGTSDRRAAPRG